jgi:hypothetical protein
MLNILRASGDNNAQKAMPVNAEADLVQQLLINLLKTNPEVVSRAFNAAQAQAPAVSVSATSAVSAPATSAVSAPATSAVSAPATSAVSAPVSVAVSAAKKGKPKVLSAKAAAKAAEKQAKQAEEAKVIVASDAFGVALPPEDRIPTVNMFQYIKDAKFAVNDTLIALAARLENSPNRDIFTEAFESLDYVVGTWPVTGICKVDGKGLPPYCRQIFYLKNNPIESIIRYFADKSTTSMDPSTYSRIKAHFSTTNQLDIGNPKVAGVIRAVFVKDLVDRL